MLPVYYVRNKTLCAILEKKKNQRQGGVMHHNVKQSYIYYTEVDYFPIAACQNVFYSPLLMT